MITALDQVSEFPLCWPPDKPRAAHREDDPWKPTAARAHQKIEDEMRRIGARGFVISMAPAYRRGPTDPGCAVWFNAKPKAPGRPAELRVLACDRFIKAEANLYAIGLTLDRLRAIDRYGAFTMEMAVDAARPMLPPPAGSEGPKDWRAILGGIPQGFDGQEALDVANARWRRMSAEAAGIEDADERGRRQVELNLAIEAARRELGP